ncbi:MAG: hypothetical protein A3B86_02870 [Candidatus Yanofskybacteria bacterium RIFCSPHIGHO2_02_FULL_38_22b]|uniref:tRNA-guanine(15) transglycosylase-like domain-containing protein n=1 Tax=Candidatus Yanofskybacteria bacterium RIFCSPHIGHO2_02_FULL_38_22b TaxID=1802673 RepID=A0A1F8F121_9BACT|nr:MAG: hypothetical protein A2816_02460 [Candidatus Yanofskybacteria bacterium RIFCSPHIGHO2_01_FULL_39_44]OGN06815.1 MAG: hypothetical protein A3B86_02870 [Candidatus Yanofskybacteria bacterium RIFCSPHIGHO2_02_FULL_38_22b]OGN20710.1 MAG: hypothetical protein A2910_00830 [Candidatus Yanofskybacteria bacterium RIFCSPLOWO2_01_FULL_39_28]
MFTIIKKDRNSKARLGVLKTAHGIVKTPSYVIVGTYGQIRYLSPSDIKKTKTQLIIANTFHLWKVANKKPLKFGKISTMTDSGGFQVLSLAFSDKNKAGKFMTGTPDANTKLKRDKIKITSNGVYFAFNGKRLFLGPELSMKIQEKIGADIVFAFDHITSPLDTYAYNKKALELTDKWAKICLKHKGKNQALFGIVQGGLFKDLRIKSAKSIGTMTFDGFGIGGSYTKKQIAKVLKWIIPHLPEEKPRHLLGVGKIEDIFEAVENGIDTFDCVIPTREARHGRLYTKKGTIDIRRGYFSKDKKVIEPSCGCPTCSKKISRSQISALLKNPIRKQNTKGQRLCLMHNMWFFNNLLEKIRKSIAKNRFIEFKKKTLTNFLSQY